MPLTKVSSGLDPSRMPGSRKRRLIYLAPINFLLLLILIDAFLAPYLESLRLPVSRYFYEILSPLCHQFPTRCLWVFGSNTALCMRCLGIYIGLLMVCLFISIKGNGRIHWKAGMMLVIPALIDGYSQLKGWRMSNNGLRLATGLLAGSGAGMIILPIYLTIIAGFRDKLRTLIRRKARTA